MAPPLLLFVYFFFGKALTSHIKQHQMYNLWGLPRLRMPLTVSIPILYHFQWSQGIKNNHLNGKKIKSNVYTIHMYVADSHLYIIKVSCCSDIYFRAKMRVALVVVSLIAFALTEGRLKLRTTSLERNLLIFVLQYQIRRELPNYCNKNAVFSHPTPVFHWPSVGVNYWTVQVHGWLY